MRMLMIATMHMNCTVCRYHVEHLGAQQLRMEAREEGRRCPKCCSHISREMWRDRNFRRRLVRAEEKIAQEALDQSVRQLL